jgi:hypothetical protein
MSLVQLRLTIHAVKSRMPSIKEQQVVVQIVDQLLQKTVYFSKKPKNKQLSVFYLLFESYFDIIIMIVI